jgi:hypothetical protein
LIPLLCPFILRLGAGDYKRGRRNAGMHRLGTVLAEFCRTLVAYVAVGGVVAEAIATSPSDERACWPQHDILWIYSSCESAFTDALWFGAIGLPRFFIVLPAIAARSIFIKSNPGVEPWIVIDNGVYVVVDSAVVFAMGSAVAAVILTGLVAWAAQARMAALLLGLALAAQIAWIAIYP